MGGFAPYLAEAVESVLAERPAAVVVVDDAADVPVPAQPHGVHVVRRAQRGGPAAARASGVGALPAEVEAVAFCDADDAWEPGSLALRVEALQAGAPWCFGRARIVGPDGRATGERWPGPPPGPLPLAELFLHNSVPTSSVLVRREVLDRAGGAGSSLAVAEDWDLWLRLAARGALPHAVAGAVVRYRRHPGGLTADVARLAVAQRELHLRHGALVDARTRRRALRADDLALASALPRRRAVRPWLRARAATPRPLLVRRRRDPYRA